LIRESVIKDVTGENGDDIIYGRLGIWEYSSELTYTVGVDQKQFWSIEHSGHSWERERIR